MKLKSTAIIEIMPYGYSQYAIERLVKFHYSIIVHTETGGVLIKALTESLKRTRVRLEHLDIEDKETIIDIIASIVQYETDSPRGMPHIRIKDGYSNSWISDYHIVTAARIDNREMLPYLAAYVIKHKLLEGT